MFGRSKKEKKTIEMADELTQFTYPSVAPLSTMISSSMISASSFYWGPSGQGAANTQPDISKSVIALSEIRGAQKEVSENLEKELTEVGRRKLVDNNSTKEEI